MSGGRFDYRDSALQYEIFGYVDNGNIPNVFEDREISQLTYDLLNLVHDFDWYKSGDTDKEAYLNSKYEFKKKWFSNRGMRIKRTIDEAIEKTKKELYETYNIPDNGEDT